MTFPSISDYFTKEKFTRYYPGSHTSRTRKNISYVGTADRPQTFSMMTSGLQSICFDLANNL